MSTVTRRRVGQSSQSDDDNSHTEAYSSTEKKIAYDPRDIDESKSTPKLTLMEEVLLLGLKDKQGYLSFWNDSISYALRGCIVIELALRGRIAMTKDSNRRKYPLADRHIEVINDNLTNEVLLDEALKMMKVSEKMSVSSWIDLMSGETWNVMKIGYQLKQVRERLAKGLVDKGVLRTEKRNFLLFDMATHPIADPAVKEEIIKRVCTMLVTRVSPSSIDSQSDIPHAYLRTVSMICAAYAANVLENALLYLLPDLREQAFSKVDELMNDYSSWPFNSSNGKIDIPSGTDLSLEVVASVLNVLVKMDAII
ncbi:Golgi phosphoprotein 3-domain-containing protein [Pilobolus umbonatus]|nr:Golgi phosphoprotein 3-domain-containing protein [Pilobolus umbonatus]